MRPGYQPQGSDGQRGNPPNAGSGGFRPTAVALPAARTLPDLFGAAVERWIEGTIRGGPLEPHLLDLREAAPELYEALVAEMIRLPEDENPDG